MFRLNRSEWNSLRSQFVTLENSLKSQTVTSKSGRGKHRKYLPLVFTEQGVAMLSTALKSDRAIMVNIAIMRTFVKIRQVSGIHRDMKQKLEELEERVGAHDENIHAIFDALKRLIEPSRSSRRKIGF